MEVSCSVKCTVWISKHYLGHIHVEHCSCLLPIPDLPIELVILRLVLAILGFLSFIAVAFVAFKCYQSFRNDHFEGQDQQLGLGRLVRNDQMIVTKLKSLLISL